MGLAKWTDSYFLQRAMRPLGSGRINGDEGVWSFRYDCDGGIGTEPLNPSPKCFCNAPRHVDEQLFPNLGPNAA